MSIIPATLFELGLNTIGDAGRAQFSNSYELSPIVLNGGIAANSTGQIPIVSYTQSSSFTTGLLSGADGPIDITNAFAVFKVLPGGTLIEQQLGKYPFANQSVAANAVIAQPLHLSILMICPPRQDGDMFTRLSIITNLKAALDMHNSMGGTYTIATPSFYYTNCILLSMRDATDNSSKQVQYQWILEFEKPLLTLEDAQQQQSTLTSKISNQVAVSGDPPAYSGPATAQGDPNAGQTPYYVPASKPLAGASVSSSQSPTGSQ